jgi:diamine N-acetyltransferase
MNNYNLNRGGRDDLDLIKPLWEKLNAMHRDLSVHFTERHKLMRWENRKLKLLQKSADLIVDYAVDHNRGEVIGYCISTVDIDDPKTGEIDSLYIEEAYRRSGIGKAFMTRAMEWLESKETETQKIVVAVGNERVLDFYEQYGFYPMHLVLQRKIQK